MLSCSQHLSGVACSSSSPKSRRPRPACWATACCMLEAGRSTLHASCCTLNVSAQHAARQHAGQCALSVARSTTAHSAPHTARSTLDVGRWSDARWVVTQQYAAHRTLDTRTYHTGWPIIACSTQHIGRQCAVRWTTAHITQHVGRKHVNCSTLKGSTQHAGRHRIARNTQRTARSAQHAFAVSARGDTT